MERVLSTLRRLASRAESILLGAALLSLAAIYGFLVVAHEVAEGELIDLDERLLFLARVQLVGSRDSVVAELALNLTALGSYPVIVLLLVLVTGFLLTHGAHVHALYIVAVTSAGALLSEQLKDLFERPRPHVVERLVEVASWSFPSGHAMAAAVTYPTLGVLLATTMSERRTKLYVLSVSLLLPVLVGASRVLLGVHYPSDVVAGWMAGLAWALLCWIAFELLLRHRQSMRA